MDDPRTSGSRHRRVPACTGTLYRRVPARTGAYRLGLLLRKSRHHSGKGSHRWRQSAGGDGARWHSSAGHRGLQLPSVCPSRKVQVQSWSFASRPSRPMSRVKTRCLQLPHSAILFNASSATSIASASQITGKAGTIRESTSTELTNFSVFSYCSFPSVS